jgi:CubicO group peptidase (beta-lactamase class C family)
MSLILTLLFTLTAMASDWTEVERTIEAGIQNKTLPGGVLLVGTKSKILFHKAFGKTGGSSTLASTGTIYDLASLTKVIATASSVMLLEERGLISLNDKFSSYFPDFTGVNKSLVTIEDLLRHGSGLPAGISLVSGETYQAFIKRALKTPLQYRPRSQTVYSDLGFILLGELVKKVSGQSLESFAMENLYIPLEMNSTAFHLSEELKLRCAPTLSTRLSLPHDPIAYRFSPHETGHAGLFSTASDLSHLVQMYMNQGQFSGKQILKKETVEKMNLLPLGEQRGLGWDFISVYASAPRGEVYPAGISYGHTGYTGTTIWIDPASDSFFIFLSNRVFLGDSNTSKRFTQLRRDLATAIAKQFYKEN